MARPSQRSWIFRWTAWMYHAYGKSATLSVTVPAPCGEPIGLPIGGEDGGSTRAGVVGGGGSTGAGFGATLAALGSSLSPGRGSAGVWGGGVRSGSAVLR